MECDVTATVQHWAPSTVAGWGYGLTELVLLWKQTGYRESSLEQLRGAGTGAQGCLFEQ